MKNQIIVLVFVCSFFLSACLPIPLATQKEQLTLHQMPNKERVRVILENNMLSHFAGYSNFVHAIADKRLTKSDLSNQWEKSTEQYFANIVKVKNRQIALLYLTNANTQKDEAISDLLITHPKSKI